MWLCHVLLLLASASLFAHLATAAGSHSLCYDLTVVSKDGSVQSGFFAKGHLDGQPFLHYDSEKGRAEPQGLWAEAVLGAEMWDTETGDLTENGKDLKKTLAEIMALQDQKGDLHSLQEIRGCEIQQDNSARGLRHFYYDGELFLSYHPKTRGWTVPQSSAQTLATEIKKSWDTDDFQSKDYWARVQGELCGRLRRYLESWMGFMERTVPPAVNVTRSQAWEGKVTLTCFFPGNISLSWLQDKKPLSQAAQQSGGVLPVGNGTYHTWVAIRIPEDQEHRFTCRVEHSGNHSAHPVPSGKALVHQSIRPAILGAAAAVVGIFSAIIAHAVWCKKKKTTSATQSPELVNLQDLDQHQMAPADLSGARQLGFQSLLSAPESTDSIEGA